MQANYAIHIKSSKTKAGAYASAKPSGDKSLRKV